jgi:hypothetical protein
VTAASYGDLQAVVAGEAHGGRHVGGAAAAGDEPGVAVDSAVPHGSGVVIVGMVSGDELAPESVDLHRGCLLAGMAGSLAAGVVGPRHSTTVARVCIVSNLDFTDGGLSETMRSS